MKTKYKYIFLWEDNMGGQGYIMCDTLDEALERGEICIKIDHGQEIHALDIADFRKDLALTFKNYDYSIEKIVRYIHGR